MKPLYQMSQAELQQAAQGNPDFTLALARLLEHGLRGYAPNPAAAIELEQTAASMGHPRAMCRLGDRYARGDGLPDDDAVARTWWRNAANAGNTNAMANLIDLKDSSDPREAAEGQHWLRVAASHGQPYAVNLLASGETSTMEGFANLSLEEMAARAKPAPSGPPEMEWDVDEVRATLAQLNDAVGWWIERLRTVWADVYADTQVDGDPVDFPCPDPNRLPRTIVSEESTMEVTVYGFTHHLTLNISFSSDGWNLSMSSQEPHPPQNGQQWLIGELVGMLRQVGVTWPND